MLIFTIRLMLLLHILLTNKLPQYYLFYFSEDYFFRALILLMMIILMYYDLISGVLMGSLLLFANIEYLKRKKIINKISKELN